MKKGLLVLIMALSLAAFALSACATGGGQDATDPANTTVEQTAVEQAPVPSSITFTDDLGNVVTVPYQPQRVVACMGSFADIWQLAGGSLVGAAEESFGDYGIDPATVASIGGFSTPDLEAILALEPDFVICTGATAGRGGTDQTTMASSFAQAGIPVAYFTVTTFDDYLRMLEICTRITGNQDALARYGTSQQEAIDAAVAKYAPKAQGKTVALLISYSSGVRVQGSSTQTGDMLADLGYTNITDLNPSLLKDFSIESLIEADPDYILLIPMGAGPEETQKALSALTASPAWQSLTAVQEGRLVILDYDMYVSKPDARWAQAYENLGAALQN
ncbi:MAG: ABC transporter substrate-binding protein [Coriobacteriales bacterium]|nr:ABC transporter substrate-binding protein [Coriobacteriales bacterium]